MAVTSKDIAAYVGQTSGLEADALASFANEDGSFSETAGEILKKAGEAFQAKLKSIDTDHTSKFDEKWNKRWKEEQAKVLDGRDKKLREKLGIDEDVRGEDLDKAILSRLQAKAKTGSGTLTDDDIEKHPFFQAAMERSKGDKEAAVKVIQDAFEAYKGEIAERDNFNSVWSRAVPMIEALNPKFDPDSETVRADQWQRIQDKLKGYKYEPQDGRTLVLDKDGRIAKDPMGNPLVFETLIAEIVKNTIGVKASENRGGAGVKTEHADKSDKAAGWEKEYPKTKTEFDQLMFDVSIPLEKRLALQKWWEAQSRK